LNFGLPCFALRSFSEGGSLAEGRKRRHVLSRAEELALSRAEELALSRAEELALSRGEELALSRGEA